MCSIVLSCINTTGLTQRPPPPRMVFFFNYVTVALIVCRISAAAVTNFNCAPGNGVDGFGGPYILDSSGMCDYMHILTVSECKYAAVYNAKNGIDSNDGFGHVAENSERPPGCYDCTTCFKESKQKYIYNSDLKSKIACNDQRNCICKTKSCNVCPKGTYSTGGINATCTLCPVGTYNDLEGNALCKQCQFGSSNNPKGAAACCGQGTYLHDAACIKCPRPEYCSGGIGCTNNRGGVACIKCKQNYYTIDGNVCVQCPKSSIGQWIFFGIGLVVFMYTIHALLDENFQKEKDESGKKKTKKGNKISRDESIVRQVSKSAFKDGVVNTTSNSTRLSGKNILSLAGTVSVVAKHALMFNFSLPLLPFIHLPEDVRAFFQQIFSLLSLDITSIVSSPDCEWQLDTVGMYMVKIVFPLCIMLVILIVKDCVDSDKNPFLKDKQSRKSFVNRLLGVYIFLWITTFYGLMMFHSMKVWDCTKSISNDDVRTLDLDPAIICNYEEDENYASLYEYGIMIILAFNLMTYISVVHPAKSANPFRITIQYCRKKGEFRFELPEWEDAHACPNFKKDSYVKEDDSEDIDCGKCCKKTFLKFFGKNVGLEEVNNARVVPQEDENDVELEKNNREELEKHNKKESEKETFSKAANKPCYDCEYCRHRQSLSWFFNKYHTSCFNFEYVVILQKLLIGGISLYLTTREEYALLSLIVVNLIYLFKI